MRRAGNCQPGVDDVVNSLLLLAEAVVYFSLMAALFCVRARVGLGLFMCALGVMHFLETYLASVFYVALPFGLASPGSTVLFSGKLVMLLLLYIKEDAATVRQPIYGLLFGNVLMIGLMLPLRLHEAAPLQGGQIPDIAFVDQMGWLMVWGTVFLFIDAIVLILLYEKLGKALGHVPFIRVAASVCAVLTFDQAGFYAVLHILADAPMEVFLGGWAAKMVAGLVFSAMLVIYLQVFEAPRLRAPRGLSDVFEMLTYRERYEALVERGKRDTLTGLLNRGRFRELGTEAMTEHLRSGLPLSLIVIEIDRLQPVIDRFGHAAGERLILSVADVVRGCVTTDDRMFRLGRDKFAVLARLPQTVARLLAENIRHTIGAMGEPDAFRISVSAGVATADEGIRSFSDLSDLAEMRLYAAKAAGEDRVVATGGNPGSAFSAGVSAAS